MVKKVKKSKKPDIQANNEYIRPHKEEYFLCLTPGCRNVIAKWSAGVASNSFCSACRKQRLKR